MIFLNIIVGAAVGYFSPSLEPKIKEIAESLLLSPVKLKDAELDLVTVMIAMMLGHIVLAILGAESSVIMMCIGVLLGVFGERIWAIVMAKADRKAAEDDAD